MEKKTFKLEKEQTGFASIDMPWMQYYPKFLSTYPIEDKLQKTIYQLAYDMNKNYMDDVAIDFRPGAFRYNRGFITTYGELFNEIDLCANSLGVIGTKKSEIVPLIVPNLKESRVLIYANSKLGSTPYPISPLLPPNGLERIIAENGIKKLVIFKGFYDKYAKVLEDSALETIVVLSGLESLPKSIQELQRLKTILTRTKDAMPRGKKCIPYSEFLDYGYFPIERPITADYDKHHIAAIIGTSGTTGVPKGVCLSDRNINAVALAYHNGMLFSGNFMDALIPSIGYGISMIHYQTVSGRYVYLIPELITTNFPEILEKLQPDNFPGGPVHYINLAKSTPKELPVYKNYISGGASLPETVERKLNGVRPDYEEEFGPNLDLVVRQGYGLSENCAMGTYSKMGSYRFGSVGIPLPYEKVAIFEPGTDKELPYYEQGEICISGECVMQGYLNNEEETKKAIMVHSDGERWIHTKDIGYMDEKGHLFHVDRIKNIFMRTGFNVHPQKIAEFIDSIPFVKNSCVIGFSHPKEQAVPVAFIELDPSKVGRRSLEDLREELRIACFDNLEETSIPVDFVFVDELPINVGGKTDINAIKAKSGIDFSKSDKVLVKQITFKN